MTCRFKIDCSEPISIWDPASNKPFRSAMEPFHKDKLIETSQTCDWFHGQDRKRRVLALKTILQNRLLLHLHFPHHNECYDALPSLLDLQTRTYSTMNFLSIQRLRSIFPIEKHLIWAFHPRSNFLIITLQLKYRLCTCTIHWLDREGKIEPGYLSSREPEKPSPIQMILHTSMAIQRLPAKTMDVLLV